MSHEERDELCRGTNLYRASTDHILCYLIVAGSGLGGGGLGGGGDDPFLVKSLEEGLHDGPISDLSTLKELDQSRSGSGQKRKSHTRKAGSWSQRMKRDLKAKYHGR